MAFFSLTSSFGRFLQAHTDGETHASNDHRGNEETWIAVGEFNCKAWEAGWRLLYKFGFGLAAGYAYATWNA